VVESVLEYFKLIMIDLPDLRKRNAAKPNAIHLQLLSTHHSSLTNTALNYVRHPE